MSEIDSFRLRTVKVTDERSEVAEAAFALIAETFARQDRHSIEELRAEVAEKRYELLKPFDYHLLAAVDRAERVLAVAIGVYLAGVNAGFVDYLVVREEARGEGLGELLRDQLAEEFAANAEAAGYPHLAAILGEVRQDNPWLLRLVSTGSAVPLHLAYYHPALPLEGGERYILYRQPVGDSRTEFPAAEVGQMLYAIYRRAYRVRYPLERETFRAMLEELATRPIVGAHPDVVGRAG